jgi:hypothetical protein
MALTMAVGIITIIIITIWDQRSHLSSNNSSNLKRYGALKMANPTLNSVVPTIAVQIDYVTMELA